MFVLKYQKEFREYPQYYNERYQYWTDKLDDATKYLSLLDAEKGYIMLCGDTNLHAAYISIAEIESVEVVTKVLRLVTPNDD